jgi:cell division protein ZapA
MAEVRIYINGRDYDIACDDGQESRIRELGGIIDKTLRDIARAGAATNESHLFVLTSLVLADEVYDLRQHVQDLQNAQSEQPQPVQSGTATQDPANDVFSEEEAHELRDAINTIAARIDTLAESIEQA